MRGDRGLMPSLMAVRCFFRGGQGLSAQICLRKDAVAFYDDGQDGILPAEIAEKKNESAAIPRILSAGMAAVRREKNKSKS